MTIKYCAFFVGAALVANAQAASIIYDLLDTNSTAAIEGGSYTVAGVTMSLSSPQGALNQTASFFGVNHATTGGGEQTDQIDGVHGVESILFSFNTEGTLTLLNFSSVGTADELILTKNSLDPVSVTQNSLTLDIDFLSTDTFELTYSTGNGISFDSATITAVPEPSSSLLLGFGGLVLLSQRKRSYRMPKHS